ncbi:hypothetical protein P4S72_02020 [Vibrio sp. PP-XX7]
MNSEPFNPALFEQKAENMKGSNGWIVQRQNVTMLANDMHLSRSLPAIPGIKCR